MEVSVSPDIDPTETTPSVPAPGRGGATCLESERDALDGIGRDLAHREARIVFLLAAGERAPRLVAPFLDGVDWQKLLFIAATENALVALRDTLAALPRGVVPVDVERRLAILALSAESRSRTMERRVEEMLIALDDAGIPAILLKGAGLATTVYRGFRDRPMNDADLLVEPALARRARDVAFASGWETDPTVPNDRVYATHHHLPPLRDGRGSGLRLEIHRAVLPPGHPFAIDGLLADARAVRVGRATGRTLAPHHQALHAALHFAWSHAMQLGGWHALRDIGALQRSGQLDWTRLSRDAVRWRAESCLYWTLRLARTLAAVDVPDDVLHALRPRLPALALSRLERHFTEQLLHGRRCPSLRVARALWTAAIRPERSGHGGVRPWLVSPELTFVTANDGLGGEARRVIGHVGRAALWMSWIVSVVSG